MLRRTLSLLAFLSLSVAATGCSITGALGLGCGECGEGCGEPCGDCLPAMADFACAAPAVEVCEPACAEACPTCAAPVLEPILPGCAAPAPACPTCAPAAMPMPMAPAPTAPATTMRPQPEPAQTAAIPATPAPIQHAEPFAAEPYPPAPATDMPPMAVPNPEHFDAPEDVNTTSYRPRVLRQPEIIPARGYRTPGQIRQAGSYIPRRTVTQPSKNDELPVMRLD